MKAQTIDGHTLSLKIMTQLPQESQLLDIVMNQCIEKLMDIPQEIYTHTSDQVLIAIVLFWNES